MPPIPPKFHDDALALIADIERRFTHVFDVELPKLRDCVGPLSLQQSFSDKVREDTLVLTGRVENLDLMVEDQTGQRNRRLLREVVDDFKRKLETLRIDTRSALLQSKRTIDSRSKSNKDELLAMPPPLDDRQPSSEEKTTENLIAKTNSDITDALRRTVALMQSELERSVLASQMLDDSTSTLLGTSTQHDTLSHVMHTSKQLITALEKADWLDRMLILSGFAFFVLVILFILKQRIVDRGIRIAFWWTRFIPSFSDDEKLLQDLEKTAQSVVLAATTAAITEAAILASSSTPVPVPVVSTEPALATDSPDPSTTAAPTTTDLPLSTESLPPDTPVHVEL